MSLDRIKETALIHGEALTGEFVFYNETIQSLLGFYIN